MEYLYKAPFTNLYLLSLRNNKISNINPLSKALFNRLDTLLLDANIISDITVFSQVTFRGLKHLYLRENKITNFEALFYSPFTANIYVDQRQYNLIQNNYPGLLKMKNGKIISS